MDSKMLLLIDTLYHSLVDVSRTLIDLKRTSRDVKFLRGVQRLQLESTSRFCEPPVLR
jgi:hypothetical protein